MDRCGRRQLLGRIHKRGDVTFTLKVIRAARHEYDATTWADRLGRRNTSNSDLWSKSNGPRQREAETRFRRRLHER